MALKTITYHNGDFGISYEISNQNCEKNLIILHGWGSNKRIMQQSFGAFFQDFCHIYIDLPGFGNSSPIPFALKTSDYVEIIKLFLDSMHKKADCIMGHSFGGKIGVLLHPKTLILLSSAGILTQKSLKVRSKIALTKMLNKILPNVSKKLKSLLRSSDVANMDENMYATFKNVVDEDFSEIFANFDNQAYIFWGKEDFTTPLSSGEKIHNLIKDSKFLALNGNHFFFVGKGKAIQDFYNKN